MACGAKNFCKLARGDGGPAVSVAQALAPLLTRPWVSPGPTMDALVKSMLIDPAAPTKRRERVATGPVGSGKTTGLMGATLINAQQQPRWQDGIVRYRLLALRDTYRNLHTQLIDQFWEDRGGRARRRASNGAARAARSTACCGCRATSGRSTTWCSSARSATPAAKPTSRTFCAVSSSPTRWLEEGDCCPNRSAQIDHPPGPLSAALGRRGRRARADALHRLSNAFLIGSWAYNTKMRGVWRPGIELFEQPSGRSPDAENLHNLSEGYYEAIVEKSDERTVRRMVDNEHVLPLAGTPVYPEFRDLVHTRKVDLDPRLPLRIGFDGGLQTLNQAAAIGQRGMARQLRFKAEVTTEHGTGVERFAELINRELGKPMYAPWAMTVKASSAPSIRRRSGATTRRPARPTGSSPWKARTGLSIRAARSNKPAPRREALRKPMTQMVDGFPGLIVDPEGCRLLREGLGGLFHYAKIRAGLASRDADTPAKNHHSHVCEAAEYLAMDDEAYGEFEGRGRRAPGGTAAPDRSHQRLRGSDHVRHPPPRDRDRPLGRPGAAARRLPRDGRAVEVP
jgi:hypothetical protein